MDMELIKMIKYTIRFSRISILHKIIFFKRTANMPQLFGTALIVAPHPDDEILGCAGLIQRLLQNGVKVHIVILTRGESSHEGCCSIDKEQLKEARKELAQKMTALVKLSTKNLYLLDYPDGGVAYTHAATQQLNKLIDDIKPDTIFVPHEKEGHPDHVEAHRIVLRLTQIKPEINIYAYCVWFWYYNRWKLDWKNAFLLKMNKAEHQLKNEAIDGYTQPLAPCGKPWSGQLPKTFIQAHRWSKELYFKLR